MRLGRRHPGRTAALLVVLLSFAALPARAHFGENCVEQTSSCPPPNIDFRAATSVAFPNIPSSLTLRLGQTDKTNPAVDVQFLVPKAWQIGLTGVPQGVGPSGPTTNCADTFSDFTLYTYKDDLSAGLRPGNTVLSNTVGGQISIDNIRTSNTSTAPITFGQNNASADPYTQGGSNGFLTLLNYDGTTANMCMYLYAHDYRADHSDDTKDPICNNRQYSNSNRGGALGAPRDPNCERSREYVIPISMTKIAATDPLSSSFGWSIHYDLGQLYRDPYLWNQNVSLINSVFELNDYWYIDAWPPPPGRPRPQPKPVALTRTPSAAGTYEFRSILRPCAEGLAPPTEPLPENGKSVGVSCKNNRLGAPVVTSDSVTISAPPIPGNFYGSAKLTGPVTAGAPTGFAVLRAATSVTVPWTQPPLGNNQRIQGYVLAVATPGREDTLHLEYLVTDPTSAGFDDRKPCGADGRGALGPNTPCSLTLNFPLSTIGSGSLTADGIYDIALITVYKDGYRTDGKCDDGTAAGVACAANVPAAKIEQPGVSVWHVLTRSQAWPDAFMQSFVNGSGPIGAYVLLVDYSKHVAQLVAWNPALPCGVTTLNGGRVFVCPFPFVQRSLVYSGTSNTIAGAAGGPGVVAFSSSTVSGGGQSFAFAGTTHVSEADGALSIWDTKNPNVTVDALTSGRGLSGTPTTFVQMVQAKRL
jgi:hypothetical protein